MKLHQILTGSCNLKDQCISYGIVDSCIFIAYGSGSDLVILNHNFVRQQIIPWHKGVDSPICAVNCCLETGNILGLYSNIVCIYDPVCTKEGSTYGLDRFKWFLSATIDVGARFTDAAWMPKLKNIFILVGNDIELWKKDFGNKKFSVEPNSLPGSIWQNIWTKSELSGDHVIKQIKCSSDGKYFATLSNNSSSLHIWFWDHGSAMDLNSSDKQNNPKDLFDHVIIRCPAQIYSFEWRTTSEFLPPGCIRNVILTCSVDNVCRVWSESYLHQYRKYSPEKQNSSTNEKWLTDLFYSDNFNNYLKQKFLTYLKIIDFEECKEFQTDSDDDYLLNSMKNKNYFIHYCPKFILCSSIDDSTDIPFFASITMKKLVEGKATFTVHWLNNKELYLASLVQNQLDRFEKVFRSKDWKNGSDVKEFINGQLSQFLRVIHLGLDKWRKSSDVIFSIHPQNGSLLVWFVHNLDDTGDSLIVNIEESFHIKNCQISVHSCLPNCFPVADAMSMNSKILLYFHKDQNVSIQQNSFSNCNSSNEFSVRNLCDANYEIKMVSHQQNGSLNMWTLIVSGNNTGSTSILNLKHISRISGHRWRTEEASCHIKLPLLLTISNFQKTYSQKLESNELILWRIKSVGPFSASGGITEVARVDCENFHNFTHAAWFPGILPPYLFEIEVSSPASFFVASDSRNQLTLYLTLPEAENVLKSDLYEKYDNLKLQSKDDQSVFKIISMTSTGEPGCILSAGMLQDSQTERETLLLHIFPNDMIIGAENNLCLKKGDYSDLVDTSVFRDSRFSETFFVVRLVKSVESDDGETLNLEMWKVNILECKNIRPFTKSLDDLIKVEITTKKVCNQSISFNEPLTFIKAVPAAGHLSSASIYPGCLAPYLIAIMCSDNSVRFLKCCTDFINSNLQYEWVEWSMNLYNQSSSKLTTSGDCVSLEISCAYSGRVAVAYLVNKCYIYVEIYECESTGGTEWMLEDSIEFQNSKFMSESKERKDMCDEKDASKLDRFKNAVHIDWINSEDGYHLLSVAIRTKFWIFSSSCCQLSKYHRFPTDVSPLDNLVRWMKVREINLTTTELLFPYIEHITWAREGLLIIGINNEIHVYNQRVTPEVFLDSDSVSLTGDENINADPNHPTLVIKDSPNILDTNFTLVRLKDAYNSKFNFKRSYSKPNLYNPDIRKDSGSCQLFIQESGLFEAAQIHNPILPQYHPKQLLEWINFGKIKRVIAILSHLKRCICFNDNSQMVLPTSVIDASEKPKTEKNRLEIKAIPPLPLHILLKIDSKTERVIDTDMATDDSFTETPMDFNVLEKEVTITEPDQNWDYRDRKMSWFNSDSDHLVFSPDDARKLSECLMRVELPGLSSVDQIYLLGIAELMSNLKGDVGTTDQAFCFNNSAKPNSENFTSPQNATSSLDDCGLRFLLAMQHFSYMSRTLPQSQRNALLNQGIDSSSIIWGFHSETEEELFTRLDDLTSHNIFWSDFKRYGCGWWIRNVNLLQRVIEKVAKNIFQKTKDPMDCAIFYLCMGKQKLLAKLFKSCDKNALEKFFSLDFSIEENKNRALNQAYNLRSKRRYDHAVALFLLSNSVADALLMCLYNLKDVQLAIIISRLYEAHVSRELKHFESITKDHIITSNDPFIRSMGFWMMEDYMKSFETLLQIDVKSSAESAVSKSPFNETVVFMFYNFLKKHSLIKKQMNQCSKELTKQLSLNKMERRLFFRTAYIYLKMGCPDLALEVLSKLSEIKEVKVDLNARIEKEREESDIFNIFTGLIDFDDSTFNLDSEFSFGEPETAVATAKTDTSQDTASMSCFEKDLDIMCLQFKFMICLKLISEELCTLASGLESNGSQLRLSLYNWLEKEVQVLQHMCKYSTHAILDYPDSSSRLLNMSGGKLMQENAETRRNWLKANESLILSLYSFCSLRSSNIVGLAAIRMELLILIQELQGNSCVGNDVFKMLPLDINLPFINSALTADTGLFITPIQYLKTFVYDIIDRVGSFKCPYLFLSIHSNECKNHPTHAQQEVNLLMNQCQALSACLFQCLSNFNFGKYANIFDQSTQRRMRQSSSSVVFSTESDIHLRSKHFSDSIIQETVFPNSDPRKWPGFSAFIHSVGCKPKNSVLNFSHILADSLVAIYIGIVIYAFHLNDANLLYRLVNNNFDKCFWGRIFGGTIRKKPTRPDGPPSSISPAKRKPSINRDEELIKDNLMNISDTKGTYLKPSSQSSEEKFSPPIQSILTALLEKPSVNKQSPEFVYDSDDDNDEDVDGINDLSDVEDEEDSFNQECQDANSFTWHLLRLALLNAIHSELSSLINMLHIDEELALFCPNTFSVIKWLSFWEREVKLHLFSCSRVPAAYVPIVKEYEKDVSKAQVAANQIKAICTLLNDKPFQNVKPIYNPVKRLWSCLVNKSNIQPVFVQIFYHLKDMMELSMKETETPSDNASGRSDENALRNIKIIHREHEGIYSLSLNQVNKSSLVTCTSKEIIELNIECLLNPEKWMQDDFDYITNVISRGSKSKDTPTTSSDFLLITPTYGSHVNFVTQAHSENLYGKLKRTINGTQILKSHPTLPYYLYGNTNGQVGVFEWGTESPIVKTYSPIQKGKITALGFDSTGNKFGMGDSEGTFSVCHFSYADNSRAHYFQTRCPHKGVADFCFLNSSSLMATCGGSSLMGISPVNPLHAVSGGITTFDSNAVTVCIWDVLLPYGRNQIKSFSDPQIAVGVVAMCFMSRYNTLIVGTKRGEIGFIDLRKNSIHSMLQAHDSGITSIKLNSLQTYFVTASLDGCVKIWNLRNMELLTTFRNEPVKTSVFKQGDVSVKGLELINDDKLISCSADGYIKLRYLDAKMLSDNFNIDV